LTEGKFEQKALEMCIHQGMPLPARIENAPQPAECCILFWAAFHELTSTRSIGFSIGPIPWTAVKAWADEHELVGSVREDLFFYVSAMDEEFLNHHVKSD